jgi:hypothetical protein
MGNQGKEGRLQVLGSQQFSSCGQTRILGEYLAMVNPHALKVHLFRVREGFTPLEEIKTAEKPVSVELTDSALYFGTQKGELFSKAIGKDCLRLKVSDFRISSISALSETRLLVEENNFINLLSTTPQMRPIFKMGHFE